MLDIQKNVKLAPLTSFKIGGPAKFFVEVKSQDDLQRAIAWAKENNEKFFILAGGSNVLFADEGYNGLIIQLKLNEVTVNKESKEVEASAGATLADVIMTTCKAGLSGMESMYGIPGTVGGAVRGNAGAFGTEIKDVLQSVRALYTQTNEVEEFSREECALDYRTSFFKQNSEWIILSAVFELKKNYADACVSMAEDIWGKRNQKHLQKVQAAGSFFFNSVAPEWVQELFEKDRGTKSRGGKVPAGYLIDKAGLRGKARVGGAFSSDQHADYIVNTGDATAKDVLELSNKIKKTVKEKFGVQLQEEVQIIDF